MKEPVIERIQIIDFCIKELILENGIRMEVKKVICINGELTDNIRKLIIEHLKGGQNGTRK